MCLLLSHLVLHFVLRPQVVIYYDSVLFGSALKGLDPAAAWPVCSDSGERRAAAARVGATGVVGALGIVI